MQQVSNHNEAILFAFVGTLLNQFSFTAMEPQDSQQYRQENQVHAYVVPETTYMFCPTILPNHFLTEDEFQS